MKQKYLHIICFDVPFPADYGGVMDVYYRMQGLHANGVKLILHCFSYGRGAQKELENLAEQVHYYPRELRQSALFSPMPFIVRTRMNENLAQRLLEDEHPILMEGHHCTALLHDERFANRECYVRIHNREDLYYAALAKKEKNLFRKWFYRLESGKLKRYEQVLSKASGLFCIAPGDLNHYQKWNANTQHWQAGIPINRTREIVNLKPQVLFQGNLSVHENEEMALWLIDVWKTEKGLPSLIIAGKKPSLQLKKQVKNNQQVNLIADPDDEALHHLVRTSIWSIAASRQVSGIKLKLLYLLLYGNEVLVNEQVMEGTGISEGLQQFDTAEDLIGILERMPEADLSEQRYERIKKQYDPEQCALKALKIMFKD